MKQYHQIAALVAQDFDKETIQQLTNANDKELDMVIANVDVENRMNARGFEQYMSRLEQVKESGNVMDTSANMTLIRNLLKPLAKAIAEYRDGYKGRKPHAAVEFFKRHDEYQLALMTLRAALIGLSQDKLELTAMTTRLVDSLENDMEPRLQIRCGWKLISLLCKTSPEYFSMGKLSNGQHEVTVLEVSEEFFEWEDSHEHLMAELAVSYRPMVCPPQPWTGLRKGGFWDKSLTRDFIRHAPHATHATHGPKAIPDVYKAVNKIQATPFKINSFVLDVANELLCDPDCTFAKFIQAIPERPHKHKMKTLRTRIGEVEEQLGITREVRTEKGKGFGKWVREFLASLIKGPEYELKKELEALRFDVSEYAKWRKDVTSKRSKNRVITTALEAANEYVNYDAFWFPCNLDWRGRVYPMTAGLTTQGTGIQKALLKFAEGKPIGTEEALTWLKVHTANSYGLDKSPWDERIKWAEDNVDLIKRIAEDPLSTLEEWKGTDSPWLFIAACEQMDKYYEHGLDAVVDIPIPMDGTCNGAQHYAAMTRDTRGAFGVNVAPNGTKGLLDRLKALRANL